MKKRVPVLLVIGALVLGSGCYREAIVAPELAEADNGETIVFPDSPQTDDTGPARPYDYCTESEAGAQAEISARCLAVGPKAPDDHVLGTSKNGGGSHAPVEALRAAGERLGEGSLVDKGPEGGPGDEGDHENR